MRKLNPKPSEEKLKSNLLCAKDLKSLKNLKQEGPLKGGVEEDREDKID